jgi:hypothetical protein
MTENGTAGPHGPLAVAVIAPRNRRLLGCVRHRLDVGGHLVHAAELREAIGSQDRAMMVIRIARTPSLNASIRPVVMRGSLSSPAAGAQKVAPLIRAAVSAGPRDIPRGIQQARLASRTVTTMLARTPQVPGITITS